MVASGLRPGKEEGATVSNLNIHNTIIVRLLACLFIYL